MPVLPGQRLCGLPAGGNYGLAILWVRALALYRLRHEQSQGPGDRLAVARSWPISRMLCPSARSLRAVTFCSSVSSSCPASPTLARVAIGRAYERLEAGE